MPRTHYRNLVLIGLLPGLAWGAPHNLKETQAELRAARQSQAAHKAAAAQAAEKLRADEAQAATLAAQQIATAAALRGLEAQTATAATALAALQSQADRANKTLQQNQAALASLLPIMQRLATQPAAAILANPATPADTARGLLVVQEIAAEIERRAVAVKTETQAVAALSKQALNQQQALAAQAAIQQRAEATLSAEIAGAHAAAAADRDQAAAATAASIAADKNIASLQTMLTRLLAAQPKPPPQRAAFAPGGAPVAGVITQNFGAATAAGPATGVVYRAAPGARVVAPCAGPVLFANQFQSYGLLVILDCGGGYDFVLSGMTRLDVGAGQIVAHGQPVGQMRAYNPGNPADQPDLYVELRRSGTPVDPASRRAGGGSG